MATTVQLFTDRDTKGATYAAALVALRDAWVDLRAHDLACANRRVLSLHPTAAVRTGVVETFANASEWAGRPLQHPVFAALPEVVLWHALAEAQAQTLIENHAG